MNLLLDDRLAPITSEIGFLQTPIDRVVRAFLDWQRPIQAGRNVSLSERRAGDTLEGALCALLPLTSVERRRFLFLATAGGWTAYFDNGHQGTDAMPPMSYLAEQLSCMGLRVVAVPDTAKGDARWTKGRYGATILEAYGAHRTEFLNYIRSISVAREARKWMFDASGTPFAFEDPEHYARRTIRERFTAEILASYLGHLGVSAFDEAFYFPHDGGAVLIEKFGPSAPGMREFSLEEARL